MSNRYPPVGFHFVVAFELFPQTPAEFGFQEVSGLNVDMETEPYKEGGENRFVHQLPVRAKYEDLVLKRGFLSTSGIVMWCQDAIYNFIFKPVNVIISLQDEKHVPLYSWYVINAYPKKWSISNFNAQENSVVVESLTLAYQFFKPFTLLNAATTIISEGPAVASATQGAL